MWTLLARRPAQYDPIQLAAGINGPPPTGLSFGSTSAYWDQGNKALVNMGLIIAGKPTF